MTRTQHLDEQELIAIAVKGAPTSAAASHIEQCRICEGELKEWSRISDATRATVDSSPPPSEDLGERILGQLKELSGNVPTSPTRTHPLGHWGEGRRTKWLVAAVATVAAAVLSITLVFGSTAPSDAMVLKRIRNIPAKAAAAAQALHFTSTTILRAPEGYQVILYRSQGAVDPRTNAFQYGTSYMEPGDPRGYSSTGTYVSDGSLVYLPCNPGWRQIGKLPCVAYPAQPGVALSDPRYLAFLRDVRGPVTSLGTRTIGGVETTGYGATVPASALVASKIPSEQSLAQLSLATGEDFHVDVWSDDQGLPRELDLTYLQKQSKLPALLHATTRELLSYSTVPLRVTVPNKNTVAVVSSLNAAVALEQQYDQELTAFNNQVIRGS
jgi:hypothetical protein